jgi:hypothetical protein
MLFRPGAQERLHSIEGQLIAWSEEADRFRVAAIAARRGEPQLATLVGAAEDTHDGLILLLEELDRALADLPAGHAEFGAVLRAQGKTVALLESVGNSLDLLAGVVADRRPEVVHLTPRKPLLAAE